MYNKKGGIRQMQYIASLSYGKDSMYMLEVIKQNNLKLDRIIHVDVYATDDIPADLPEMVEFKKYADNKIKERYGIEVEHFRSSKTYEDCFYKKFTQRSKRCGEIYGFPYRQTPWCNSSLKLSVLNQFNKKDIIQYVGIASDEPKRLQRLEGTNKIAPLAMYNVTEAQCYSWCQRNGLLSPIYSHTPRGGCWFCHNQRLTQLKYLRQHHKHLWELLLKWDKDSPVAFRSDKKTVHDLEEMFRKEELGLTKPLFSKCLGLYNKERQENDKQ